MRKFEDIQSLLDLDLAGWEKWLYGIILPAGFILAGVIGALIR